MGRRSVASRVSADKRSRARPFVRYLFRIYKSIFRPVFHLPTSEHFWSVSHNVIKARTPILDRCASYLISIFRWSTHL